LNPASTILAVAGVILVAAFVRSSLGFGDAVLAMPLLALLLDLKTAAPLVAFVGPTISILILAGHWRKADLKAASKFIVASLAGIPLGVYGLARLPEKPLQIALGSLIVLYGLFGLWKPQARLTNEKRGLPFLVGFGAGILGGAYNTNGPPVVAYGLLKGWDPRRFRATLQGYFLPTGLAILAGHGAAGLWTREVVELYAFSLPGLILGILAGGMLNKNLGQGRFNRLVYITLILMGGLLLTKSF
jgi:uncharacterized membrane protein YfcA